MDIVERLRLQNDCLLGTGHDFSDVLLDAANEIERLQGEVEERNARINRLVEELAFWKESKFKVAMATLEKMADERSRQLPDEVMDVKVVVELRSEIERLRANVKAANAVTEEHYAEIVRLRGEVERLEKVLDGDDQAISDQEAEIERLRSSFAAADEALAPCSSALEDCDQENQRLRELLREAVPLLPIYGDWKQAGGMLVRTEHPLLKRVREALGDD